MENQQNQKPILIVSNNDSGQRVDNYLFKHRKQLNKTTCYKLMRKGQIRINGKRIKPTQKLVVGDEVRMPPFVFFVEEIKISFSLMHQKQILQHVIFEDDDYLVLNKPAGLPVHKGTGHEYGVFEIINSIDQYKETQLAHRLDKGTSGCLLLSKNRQALLSFQAAMKECKIEKKYTAILKGMLNEVTVVNKALNTSNRVNGLRTVIVDDNGHEAKTIFTPIKSQNNMTLCECQIFQGRTHQIRVHAQYINHPVLGDNLYGQVGQQNRMMYLHASQLKFLKYKFEAKVPNAFNTFLL